MASEAIYFLFIIYYMFVQVWIHYAFNLLPLLVIVIKSLTQTPLLLAGEADEAAEMGLFQE